MKTAAELGCYGIEVIAPHWVRGHGKAYATLPG
jgi:hypothetical protein